MAKRQEKKRFNPETFMAAKMVAGRSRSLA